VPLDGWIVFQSHIVVSTNLVYKIAKLLLVCCQGCDPVQQVSVKNPRQPITAVYFLIPSSTKFINIFVFVSPIIPVI
jgi:hypothetical protein